VSVNKTILWDWVRFKF